MKRASILFLALVLCTSTSLVSAQDAASLASRMNRALIANTIDDPQMPPWYLKLSFQLLDAKGEAKEKGTIEEWWNEPSLHKTVYTSPSYTATEIQTKDGLYQAKGASSPPPLLELALEQVMHPVPREYDVASSKLEMQTESFGKVKLDCIMLGRDIEGLKHAPMGLLPTYCFDPGKDILRATSNFGSQVTIRNHTGAFVDRNVAIDQETSFYSTNVLSAHIEALKTISADPADFVPTDEFEKVPNFRPDVGDTALRGQLIRKVDPIYPKVSRQDHVSGTVAIAVVIDRDGRVQSMKLISTPDSNLANAAMTAVRQWIYSPYLLNGKPTEVETKVTINFSFK